MRARVCGAFVLLLLSGAGVGAAEPPKEIQDKVKAFEESIQKSKVVPDDVKKAIGAGGVFYGVPAFLGGTDRSGSGDREYFMFWLYNPSEKPTYRGYAIRLSAPAGQALMKTVLFAFKKKTLWVAVYPKAGDEEQPIYVAVYP